MYRKYVNIEGDGGLSCALKRFFTALKAEARSRHTITFIDTIGFTFAEIISVACHLGVGKIAN
jgi:hypothetical protein